MLTGYAGVGKSGVVRELIKTLEGRDIPHLAVRIDRNLDVASLPELGMRLLERSESPVITLARHVQSAFGVLIVDQVDAISDASGRAAPAKDLVTRIIRQIQNFDNVKLVLVCRSFDLENDVTLKQVQNDKASTVFNVPPLDWSEEVEPVLRQLELPVDNLSAGQRELLTLPLNLEVFLELRDAAAHFASTKDLFGQLLKIKERNVRVKQAPWSMYDVLHTMSGWMSEYQTLDVPLSELRSFSGVIDLLGSEHLIFQSGLRVGFFHESLFDFLFAQRFAERHVSICATLLECEQELFRRTQVRQILDHLRDVDRVRYMQEIDELLANPDVRYHIKHAVLSWLAQLSEPTYEELEFVKRHCSATGRELTEVLTTPYRSTGWLTLSSGFW